jgi:hypothetical protein
VNHPKNKQDPMMAGTMRRMLTNGNHHLMYSFMIRKNEAQTMYTVKETVKIPITSTPHLMGKQPQQVTSLVS